jgi:protocatechuate 3,4-dioxygenase beta subunit
LRKVARSRWKGVLDYRYPEVSVKVPATIDRLIRTSASARLDRRTLLCRLGLGLAAMPLLAAACGGDDGAGSDVDAAPSGDQPDAIAGGDWATGGVAAMTDKASYPDPFTEAVTTCVVVAATTEGPCTTETDLDREDVSEGWAGLPVRLALKVVDASCAPIAGATVKIWHTNREGIYSGDTPNHGMCNDDNADYIAMDFFRGVRTTDAAGVVYFDTCYPGWYSGRAIHIHFQVSSGTTTYKISQLFFPEDVTAAIFASHVDYREFGQPNTTFANDNIARGIDDLGDHTVAVARMTDGAMLASKVVAVRS